MTKNLETADKIAKLTLSVMCLTFYALGIIQGPFARSLMILSTVVILLYAAKTITRNK